LEARWVTTEEFLKLDKIRGYELYEWGTYINNGGHIFPIEAFAKESDDLKKLT
jgi:hypothetical protein